jgi:uncharacterized membrane protein
MSNTKKIVLSALLCALVCVVTTFISIPSPFNGNINLGDSVVVLSAVILPPPFSLIAMGVGSALADLFAGYVTYAPVTFVIKGLMPLIIWLLTKVFDKITPKTVALIISAVIAELFMVAGYLLFESILYGFVPSLVNVPLNAIQGATAVIVGVLMIKLLKLK